MRIPSMECVTVTMFIICLFLFSHRYGRNKMQFIRASRVDFFTQHSTDMWKDNLASLGFVDSDGLVFCNLAAISGPLRMKGDRMADVKSKQMVKGQGGDVDSMMDVSEVA